MSRTEDDGPEPRILVFSTNNISDPGIDLAGSRHLHYPATVSVLAMPCSSGIKPAWIVHALESGQDGVFIASDGEECAFLPDCAERTSRIAAQAQELMKDKGLEPNRLKMAAVCSVCAEPFAKYMREFADALNRLGSRQVPVG
ncbi:hydrogenase iron-sulfur subunit [Actinotalea sp.]|uniref:hydrogenase iron-sulfur subunit n=1 Tax=Actinotalea sp. TaxID=1872145 RepID=UPI0035630879